MASYSEEINILKKQVKGTVISKDENSSEYRNAIRRWNQVFTKKAAIVGYVETEDDIVECMKFVNRHDLDLAVCGGGHALKGTSSSDGLVIDLRNMHKVTVDQQAKRVFAQGGCKTAQIDEEAWKYGLAVVAGLVNTTGMGIALGGGLGWLTGQYGYMVDNIISVRMVLADGTIVTASETENQDLFWAVRGTGGGFGIVTEFEFRAYKQGQVFAGPLMYEAAQLPQLLSIANELQSRIIPMTRGKLQMHLAFASPPPNHEPATGFLVFYSDNSTAEDPSIAARSLLAPLYELGPIFDATATIPYPASNSLLNPNTDTQNRHGLSGANLPVDPMDEPLLLDVWNSYVDMRRSFPGALSSHVVVELRYLVPGDEGHDGKTDMAFAARGGLSTTNVLVHPQWDDPGDDTTLRKWATDLTAMIRSRTRAQQQKGAVSYPNYASGDESAVQMFGPEKYERLRDLKAEYDPDMRFNKWYPVHPREKSGEENGKVETTGRERNGVVLLQ